MSEFSQIGKRFFVSYFGVFGSLKSELAIPCNQKEPYF